MHYFFCLTYITTGFDQRSKILLKYFLVYNSFERFFFCYKNTKVLQRNHSQKIVLKCRQTFWTDNNWIYSWDPSVHFRLLLYKPSPFFWEILLQSCWKYMRQTLVLVWNSTPRGKFNFNFWIVFRLYWQNFHFGRKTVH